MLNLATPVQEYMNFPVHHIAADASMDEASKLLEAMPMSALAVFDRAGMLRGVISRADLVASVRDEDPKPAVPAPPRVADHMSTPALTVPLNAPLSSAAKTMLHSHVHRLFVTSDGTDELVGVVATPDLIRAVRDLAVKAPVRSIASSGIITVGPEDTIAYAEELMQRSNTHAIVVVDGEWPIGVFDQAAALRARNLDPDTPVEKVQNWAILVVDDGLALGRAAAMALATSTHRLVVLHDREVWGVVDGFDFARLVS